MSQTFRYSVNGRFLQSADGVLDGRQIRSSAGLQPASDHVLIRIDSGLAQSIGLEEQVTLATDAAAAFRAFAADHILTFTVNERGWEWGADQISEQELREIGQVPEDHELYLDSDRDRPIEPGSMINLKGKGVEQIRSRPAPPKKVKIIVNTRPKEVDPGLITFEQVVTLAYPDHPGGPNVSYTVGYRKGPKPNPEGFLVAGESVRVIKGMVFNVTATDKS